MQIRSGAALLAFGVMVSACDQAADGRTDGGRDRSRMAPVLAPRGGLDDWGLRVSANHHGLERGDGTPFVWKGDAAWLLVSRLKREDIDEYLERRARQGYNVVQVTLLDALATKNAYDVPALQRPPPGVRGGTAAKPHTLASPPLKPYVSPGRDALLLDAQGFSEFDFWDSVDYAVKKAESLGLYLAMVPLWNASAVTTTGAEEDKDKTGVTLASVDEIVDYAEFLAARYRDAPNIIWLEGDDGHGDRVPDLWRAFDSTLHLRDPGHLMSFHPLGKLRSQDYFPDAEWADLDMLDAAGRTYAWDAGMARAEVGGAEAGRDSDNTGAVPADSSGREQMRAWTSDQVQRYAHWSVMAGAFGHTYGNPPVYCFATAQSPAHAAQADGPGDAQDWQDVLEHPATTQMMDLGRPALSQADSGRVPDDSLVADQQVSDEHIIASRGRDYLFAYTYTGRTFHLNMGKLPGESLRVSWFNPRAGETLDGGVVDNRGVQTFDPPGEVAAGHDWVLVLDAGG